MRASTAKARLTLALVKAVTPERVLAYTRDGAVYCDDCGAGLPDDDETGAWFADDEESLVGQTCNTCTACYMPDGDGWTPHESAVRDYRWSECQACGTQRPWHAGVLYHQDTRFAHALLQALRDEGDLVVGDNEPYSVSSTSDYAVPVHGEGRGLVHVELEIRQDLIADAAGQQAWAERLARIFSALQPQLLAFG